MGSAPRADRAGGRGNPDCEPHNTQAWVVHVSPQRLELFTDRACNTGAVDPFNREMYVGLGCAIENLLLAAEPNGYQATLRLLPDPRSAGPCGDDRAVSRAGAQVRALRADTASPHDRGAYAS